MDPISHGIIGVAISSFSGQPVALSSAITIGSMLGAMSPDLDFIIRIFKDDVEYLENHRGFSHSVPMLFTLSLGITLLLSLMPFEAFSFMATLIWTFVGALSHTFFDILNSYGARLLKQKVKGNILTLYDPIVLITCFYLIWHRTNNFASFIYSSILICAYFGLRWYLREEAKKALYANFSMDEIIDNIIVMPALKLFYKWDFVVSTDQTNYVGQFTPFSKDPIKITRKLDVKHPDLMSKVLKTPLGERFASISPAIHIEVIEENASFIVVRLIDMRYFFRNTFLHQATLVLDSSMNPLEGVIHPYKLSKAVPVAA